MKHLFTFLFILSGIPLFPQLTLTPVWETGIYHPGSERGAAIFDAVVDVSDNVIVCGVRSALNGHAPFVASYTAAGTSNWEYSASLSPGSHGWFNRIAADPSGNIYVVGTKRWDDGHNLGFGVKINAAGTEEWVKDLGEMSNSVYAKGIDVDLTAAGSPVFAYQTGNTVPEFTLQAVVEQFDPSGNSMWRNSRPAQAGSGGSINFEDMITNTDGDILVSGQVTNDITDRYYYLKIAADGTTISEAENLLSSSHIVVKKSCFDQQSNVYITGEIENYSHPKLFLAKVSASGALEWSVTYSEEDFSGFDVLSSGASVYVLGSVIGSFTDEVVKLIKLSESGDIQWEASYPGGTARAMVMDAAGTIHIGAKHTDTPRHYTHIEVDDQGNLSESDLGSASFENQVYVTVLLGNASIFLGTGGRLTFRVDGNATLIRSDNGNNIWEKTETGEYYSHFEPSVAVSDSRNVLYSGGSVNDSTGNYRFYIDKLDGAGNHSWSYTYADSTSAIRYFTHIGMDASENVMGVLQPANFSSTLLPQIIKVDASGNELYVVPYNYTGFSMTVIYDMLVTPNGRVVLAGKYSNRLIVACLEANGTLLWQNDTIIPQQNFQAKKIIQDGEGGFIIAAETYSLYEGDLYYLRLDENGIWQWMKPLVVPSTPEEEESVLSLTRTSQGKYLMLGKTRQVPSGNPKPIGVWFDKEGNELRIEQFSSYPMLNEPIQSTFPLSNGSVLLASTSSNGKAYMTQANENGIENTNEMNEGYVSGFEFTRIMPAASSHYLLIGTDVFSKTYEILMNTNGAFESVRSIDNTPVDYFPTENGEILSLRISNTPHRGIAGRYKLGIAGLPGNVDKNKSSLVIFPNPANASATINISNAVTGKYTLQMFDFSGKLLFLQAAELKTGENQLVVTGLNSIAPGLYLVQLCNGSSCSTGKLLIDSHF